MSDFQNDMNRSVEGFVAKITDLARRAAMETLESAFDGRSAGRRGARAALASPLTEVAQAGRPRGGRGAKRAQEDIDALASKFAAFVKANPGLRIEQINKELGTTTKGMALPIRKLIAEGMISAKGKRRATAYFPGAEGEELNISRPRSCAVRVDTPTSRRCAACCCSELTEQQCYVRVVTVFASVFVEHRLREPPSSNGYC
jgi:hypothetical protein